MGRGAIPSHLPKGRKAFAMQLNIPERLSVMELLPSVENHATLRMVWRANLVLAPTAEEIKYYEFEKVVDPAGREGWKWNDKAINETKDIPLDEPTLELIKRKLLELDKEHKLDKRTDNLFDKFVMTYQGS